MPIGATFVRCKSLCWIVMSAMLPFGTAAATQQQAGSIRGVVYDKDFDVPLAAAQVMNVETGQRITTTDQGNFVFSQVPPGKYTLVFSKEGYVRQVKADVVVSAGQLTDVDASLSGEFTEMDEFVVQDILQVGGGSESALLKLRFESPALMDSVSADLMSRAGAGDAASALRLVSGASVQDGKYAVIRGLPDRYVSSQMNGVRLPTADEDKRAVELDQFPAVVIQSLQVTKTFTPDQQGDASGGAVNVQLKGIPDESILQFSAQTSYNSQVNGDDFLTYKGGGVNFWGRDDGDRDIQTDNLGANWDGAAGTTRGDAPTDYKLSGAVGGKRDLDSDVKIGGFASLFYERDSSFYDNGINDSYWVVDPTQPMTPETVQGVPDPSGNGGDFKTALFDVTRGQQSVRWGGLGTLGLETEKHSLGLTYLYTRIAEDTATLAEDTRGKAYFFPGYDVNDPLSQGNNSQNQTSAPYLRLETLEYTERTTSMLQLNGRHKLPIHGFEIGDAFRFGEPELDWSVAHSVASLDQPDKRQFGALWQPGAGGSSPIWLPFKPAANFTLGNFQRIWKDIEESSDQYSVNLKLPFEQWSEDKGYVKLGLFGDDVTRSFNQDTFSNFNDFSASFEGGWDESWSDVFPSESHPISDGPPFVDVDYKGNQSISAWYAMMDLPLSSSWNVIGGMRFESTKLEIVNDPEADASWVQPGATAPVDLNPGDADVQFQQDDALPSIGFAFKASEQITLRSSYSQTVARQTFKELTPILQQEYLGGPIFVGNPDLQMSALKNYDLRLDYTPYEGGLVSASVFYKDIEAPIEYVQRFASFTYTTPVNYPKGDLKGCEVEVRQSVGRFWDKLDGLSVGANATFLDSEVRLPDDEIAAFQSPTILAPLSTRDMTNAPDHLYNLYFTYDVERTATQFALFYTVQGDTLVAGAQPFGNFVPSVYAKEYDTLNMSVSQKLGRFVKLQFQAKNLTNPKIEEVYRSEFIGDDITHTSYTKGVEYSLSVGVEFSF